MVGVSHDQGLTCVTLDNAAANNTLTVNLLEKMLACLADLPRGTRALLLRSAGEIFSYGLDLSSAVTANESSCRQAELAALEGSRVYAQLLDRLHRLPVPTMVLVQGPCKAGGLGLVAACDLVLCTHGASFQLSEALLGLLPANVSPYLARRVGEQKLLQLTLTLDEIDAIYARRIGLADYVVADSSQLDQLARRLLKQIFRCSPDALALMKSFVSKIRGLKWEEQLQYAERLLADLLVKEENKQAIEQLQQGDLPPWSCRFRVRAPLALEASR